MCGFPSLFFILSVYQSESALSSYVVSGYVCFSAVRVCSSSQPLTTTPNTYVYKTKREGGREARLPLFRSISVVSAPLPFGGASIDIPPPQ